MSSDDRPRALLSLLARGSEALGAAVDLDGVARATLEVALPALGDFGVVDVVQDDGEVRRLARAHDDPAVEALLAGTRWVRSTNEALNVCALSSGRAALHPAIDDAWLERVAVAPAHLELMRSLGFRSMLTTPLLVRGRPLGALTLFHGRSGRRHDALDAEAAAEVARRAAAALEVVRLRADAAAAQARARALERRRDDGLIALGHELRNPLASLRASLELLDRRDDPATARERAALGRSAARLETLVEELLDLSQVRREAVRLAPAPVEVDALVAAALARARLTATVDIDVPAGLVVLGDAGRLAQALGSVLAAAGRATPEGGRVRVRARAEGARVEVEVEDEGGGRDADALARALEEPFAREPLAGLAREELGAGVWVARRLCELHGGSLGAEPLPGGGARLTLRLPAAPVEAAGAARACRTLLVDDNVDAADMLAMGLDDKGYEVVVAYDGPSALAAVDAFTPDAALVDLGLPGMNGVELGAALRARFGAGLRLIALTGYSHERERARTAAAGFDAHLVKPADLKAIARALGPSRR